MVTGLLSDLRWAFGRLRFRKELQSQHFRARQTPVAGRTDDRLQDGGGYFQGSAHSTPVYLSLHIRIGDYPYVHIVFMVMVSVKPGGLFVGVWYAGVLIFGVSYAKPSDLRHFIGLLESTKMYKLF